MTDWIVIVLMIVAANALFAFAMNGASRAFRDWGAAYSSRRRPRASSS